MAKVRINKTTGSRLLTLAWQEGDYAEQEHILAQYPKSRAATRLLMEALLDARTLAEQNQQLKTLLMRLHDENERWKENLQIEESYDKK